MATYDDLGGVRIATAAEKLGYDKSTIRRKIAAGDLETYGSGVGLRVTLRSIRAYQNGERGIWRKSEKTNVVNMETAPFTLIKTARSRSQSGSKKEKSPPESERLTPQPPKWLKPIS